MFKVIEQPADCEIRSVIHFLNARNFKPADIHQLCEVYGEDAISDGMVRRWVRKFNEGCISVHDEQRTGQQSRVFLVLAINPKCVRKLWEEIITFLCHLQVKNDCNFIANFSDISIFLRNSKYSR